jgi:hypothetical protein
MREFRAVRAGEVQSAESTDELVEVYQRELHDLGM